MSTTKDVRQEDFKPAEVFHASDLIAEEAISRGWSIWTLALKSGATTLREIAMCVLGWQLYALRDPDVLMGADGAKELSLAFGVDAEIWLRIEETYRKHADRRSTFSDPARDAWFDYENAPLTPLPNAVSGVVERGDG